LVVEVFARPVSGRLEAEARGAWPVFRRSGRAAVFFDGARFAVEAARLVVGPLCFAGWLAGLVARFRPAGEDGVLSSRFDREPSRGVAAFRELDAADFVEDAESAAADRDDRPPFAAAFFAGAFLAVVIVITPSGSCGLVRFSG